MNNQYLLMNKDVPIMGFSLTEVSGVYFYGDVSVCGKLPIGLNNISEWISKRFVIMDRHRAEVLMQALGLIDDKSKIEFTHCTSLFDSFWIKAANSSLKWENVSLYRNSFSEYLSLFTMSATCPPKTPKGPHISPEYNTSGSFDHMWKWAPNGLEFFKAGSHGYANAGKEPFSEVYTNQLEDALELTLPYVHYELQWLPRRVAGTKEYVNSPVTVCPAMTDESTGLISADKLGITSYEEFLDYCENELSEGEKEKAIELLFLDCLTYNVDRHLGNISFFINNDAVTVTGISHIYDNNQALLPYYMEKYDGTMNDYAEKLVTKLGMEFDDLWILCYERSERKSELRKKLRRIASSFSFEHIPFDEELFPEERVKALSEFVRSRAVRMLEITKSRDRNNCSLCNEDYPF